MTLALDHAGHERFRVDGPIVTAAAEGNGWVFLMPGDVRRVRQDGSTAWTTPMDWGGTSGQLLCCPDGDLIGLTYNRSGETYQVIRLDSLTGAVKWRYTKPWYPSNHFVYSLEAHMELRRGLLAITQDGTDGTYVTVIDARTGQAMP